MAYEKFYLCEKCGNVIEMVSPSGVPVVCCGQKMTKLEAGTTDASREKHVPTVTVNGNTVEVCVGAVIHPMTPEHSIQFIYLLTNKGVKRVDLSPVDEPKATFTLAEDEKAVAVYEYCNLHGLWKKEL